jgi:hypothetical protein
MWLQSWKQLKAHLSLSLKCGTLVLLLTLCLLVIACGSTANNQVDLDNPAVTVTVGLNASSSSPTPPLPDYLCGAWVTDTSPAFGPGQPVQPISVFAKFVHTVNENPVGVDSATATATILWPDQSTETATTRTTPDGLAVFSIVLKPDAVNKLVLVQVAFTKDGTPPCRVSQPAYFTPVLVSPTVTLPPVQPTPPFGMPPPFLTPLPSSTPPVVTPSPPAGITTPGPTVTPGH